MNLETYVNHRFKKTLKQKELNKYLIMARFLDESGDEALSWNYTEAYEAFVRANGLKYGNDTPLQDDWKKFLQDGIIIDILTKMTVKSQAVVLRKLLKGLDNKSNLDQGTIKAIVALKELIDKSEQQDSSIIYVQYLAPVRYGDHDNIKIVEDLTVKKNG